MKTIPIEGRVDLCRVAELALWMSSRKGPPRSKSEIVATAIETVANLAVSSGEVSRITSQEDALAILEGLGISPGKRSLSARATRLALQTAEVQQLQLAEEQEPAEQSMKDQLEMLKREIHTAFKS